LGWRAVSLAWLPVRRETGIDGIPVGHVSVAANQSHWIKTPLFRRPLLLNFDHFSIRNMPSPLGNKVRHRWIMMEEGIKVDVA